MTKKKTKEEIINIIKEIKDIDYNLEKTIFNGSLSKVCVICPKHGEYFIRIDSLKRGCRCKKCSSRRYSRTGKEIKELSSIIHKGVYSYKNLDDNEKYAIDDKIKIICHEHGIFEQTVESHLRGKGCWYCGHKKTNESNRKSYYSFLKEVQKKHNNEYRYVEKSFIDMHTKMEIICPKHGKFSQTPSQHLFGRGCPICASSKLEKYVLNFLKENNIKYIREATSSTLSFLKRYRLDFYLPDYNVGIECQGLQHFQKNTFFAKKDGEREKNDKAKRELCEKNGVKIFYYSNLGIEYPYKVYENLDELLKEIKEHSYFETMKEVLCEAK